MNSGLNRNPRLNIRSVVKRKAAASGSIIPMAYMFILLTIVFVIHMYRVSLIEFNYDYINNALTQSLLGGCVVNVNEYAETGAFVIQDEGAATAGDGYVINSYNIFRECLKSNMELDENWNITISHGITGRITINEYRIYNVIDTEQGKKVTEFVISSPDSYFIEHPAGETVSVETTDGIIEIKETSVYAEISFTLHLMGYTPLLGDDITEDMVDRQCSLSRVVAVKQR